MKGRYIGVGKQHTAAEAPIERVLLNKFLHGPAAHAEDLRYLIQSVEFHSAQP